VIFNLVQIDLFHVMMLLENNILKLRSLEPHDLDLLYDWENNTEIWEVGNTLVPYSKFILHQYIENSHRDLYETKQLRLIIELKSTIPFLPIGTIDLFDIDFHNQHAAVGILIAKEEQRNKGYASATIKLLEEYAAKRLNLSQLHCKIDAGNQLSLRLFQGLGYQVSGKLIQWKRTSKGLQDVFILQHILS
jgi:diamine N-acetyltransferase